MCNPDDNKTSVPTEAPEVLLAKMFKDDLGVMIEPQALRMFIRWRWERITPVAHRIHGI